MTDQTLRSAATADDLLTDFRTMSKFGATAAGGVERQAATPEDRANRAWLRSWLFDRGFQVSNDSIGNMFGLYEFTPGAPYVLAGSHLDSQPNGGKYDGAYGVLAAAHAADRLRRKYRAAQAKPPLNIGVVNWFNEEGSRFKPSMMGSGVFCGKIPLDRALGELDTGGNAVADVLAGSGEQGEANVVDPRTQLASYAEIHIEQGPILDKEGIDIGLVTSTWAANKYEIAVHGAQAHTGATSMPDRQDALYGAALAVVAVRELADRFGENLHTSCGQLTVHPNSPVVVPAEVRMHFDLRSASQELLDEADAVLQQQFSEIEVKADVRIEKKVAHHWPEAQYQPAGVAVAREVAHELGLSIREIRTLAGHDSTNVKDLVPTVMLFVPSVDGVSHNELEHTADEDLEKGLELLTGALDRMIHRAL